MGSLPTHDPASTLEKNTRKFQGRNSEQNICPGLFKTVMLIKSRENLKNRHSQEERKET